MPVFSIIVPVYNAEKTLRKCLESIRSQTCPDFEVLMVENGSKDTSNAICSEYTAMDSRFVLYACETNRGPSGARNIGLEHAEGQVIAFVDSDDFVEADYLETLQQGFAEADVVFFGYHQLQTDGTSLGIHLPDVAESTDYYETLIRLHGQDMFGYTWIKAFRREVIGQHRFSAEQNLLEDEVFVCEVLTEQKRIRVIPKALYNYVTGNAGSLVGRTHADYCRKVDAAYCAWKNLLAGCAEKNAVLVSMANAHVRRCMYYGFERNVDVKAFFGFLSESTFFAMSAQNDAFSQLVLNGKYRKLACMKTAYRLKNKIARLLKR